MKRYRLLLSGQALSTLGDILYILALVTTLYRQSGSAAVAALFPLLRVIGMAAGGFAAPLLLGRLPLGLLLAVCLFGQTAGMAGLALYLQADASPGIGTLTAVVFVLSLLEGIAGPARSSLLPQTVTQGDLLKANGTLGAVTEVCSLAGWAFGAIAVSGWGAAPSLWGSSALLLASGCAAVMMRVPQKEGTREENGDTSAPLLTGWKTLFRIPALRLVLWMDVWEGIFASAFAGALLLVFAQEQLQVGETWWGWMNGAYCLGLILANAAIGRFVTDTAVRLPLLLFAGAAGMALFVGVFSFTLHPGIALAVMLLIGLADSARGLAGRTLVQLAAPARELPSVFAAHSALIAALYGLSLLLTGWMADRYGIRTIYIGAAVCYIIAFLGAYRYRRTVREAAHKGREISS
jgi:DHA3 family macrolide efflux protein-like MFS transporter